MQSQDPSKVKTKGEDALKLKTMWAHPYLGCKWLQERAKDDSTTMAASCMKLRGPQLM
jgi:hypothetical protein